MTDSAFWIASKILKLKGLVADHVAGSAGVMLYSENLQYQSSYTHMKVSRPKNLLILLRC